MQPIEGYAKHRHGSLHFLCVQDARRCHRAFRGDERLSCHHRFADYLGLPFYEDCASCHSKQRVNAEFTLNREPSETNIIVFDDFVTTGQTMLAMKRLFAPLHHNLVFVAAINNKS